MDPSILDLIDECRCVLVQSTRYICKKSKVINNKEPKENNMLNYEDLSLRKADIYK